jgi:hypothetical protein
VTTSGARATAEPAGSTDLSPAATDRRPVVALGCVAGCLLLGLVSWLLWPSAVGYDPMTWAVWGREVAHGRLAIGAGDAVFKPWPVAVDAVLSLLHLPVPASWAVLLRAGTAGALLAAIVLGRRTAGPVGGVFAALALAAVPRFLV